MSRRSDPDFPRFRGRRGLILRRLGTIGSTKPDIYRRPRDGEDGTHRIYPTGEMNSPHLVVVRYYVHRGLVVDFSINQLVVDDVGAEHDVARIDTKHGTVHRHQFYQDGRPEWRWDILPIPAPGDTSSWEIVNKAYDTYLDVMHDEWDDNVRRWRG